MGLPSSLACERRRFSGPRFSSPEGREVLGEKGRLQILVGLQHLTIKFNDHNKNYFGVEIFSATL